MNLVFSSAECHFSFSSSTKPPSHFFRWSCVSPLCRLFQIKRNLSYLKRGNFFPFPDSLFLLRGFLFGFAIGFPSEIRERLYLLSPADIRNGRSEDTVRWRCPPKAWACMPHDASRRLVRISV
ncbi:hypothetical protein AVEN_10503-1 [Araneus ventricosus]|uniref:Uncharacterized protein n=1 Tax=Araneus ventricosus TaxID=182803 RepID=A0A4Y2JF59_ARAVE|nr:hypothetical protein AVEN_10503-1 [Araneus ventricosus]